MEEIQVSVYCLAYNHEKYIKETLEGFISQQTNFNFEVVVHDDASTDNTVSIIKTYADKYPEIIKPIYQTQNQYSQNKSIFYDFILPKLRGRYIASCEGDDYWDDPLKLQTQFDILETHPECSVCVHKVKCCNEDGSSSAKTFPEESLGITGDGILSNEKLANLFWIKLAYPFHTSSYFYRKSVRLGENNPNNWTIFRPRDRELLLAFMISGKYYYIDKPMSTRRLNSINNWNSKLKASGNSGFVNLAKCDVSNDFLFDKFTNHKYHNFITTANFSRILSWSYIDPYDAINDLKKYGIKYSDVKKNLNPKRKFIYGIKYSILKTNPKLLKKLLVCIRKLFKK